MRKIIQLKDNKGAPMLPKTISSAIEIIGKNKTLDDILNSYWVGKTIAFLGDSITDSNYVNGGQYVRSYQALTNCVVSNHGASGTHMAKKSSSEFSDFMSRSAGIPNTVDMVIVFGGTNDFGHPSTASPFGYFTDGANPSLYTFYSGLHNLFKSLYLRFSIRGIPVVIMTPIHHGNTIDTKEYTIASDDTLTEGINPSTGKSFKQYVEAIKEVAAYYSLNVIDAYSHSGINPCLDLTYSVDGLHLNDAGGLKLAKFIYPLLEDVYEQFYNN